MTTTTELPTQNLVILNLGLGNLHSVQRSLELAAQRCKKAQWNITISADPKSLSKADRIVLPGQGAFRNAAKALQSELGTTLKQTIANGIPYLGICLGLQLLFETSEEAPGEVGLSLFPGHVQKLKHPPENQANSNIKIPHMGWNQLTFAETTPPFLKSIESEGRWVYFVHSFHAVPADQSLIVATADHGPNRITAAIARKNVFATQFHPEKSGEAGLHLLHSFLESSTDALWLGPLLPENVISLRRSLTNRITTNPVWSTQIGCKNSRIFAENLSICKSSKPNNSWVTVLPKNKPMNLTNMFICWNNKS
jgi:imidazole glycerol-phosphate synthase subunit HisH